MDKHGIKNLHLRDAVVSLVAEKRKKKDDAVKIAIASNKEILLNVF